MTSFPAARALVLKHAIPLGTETTALRELGGRTFAEDLVCPFDVPHFDNSQVDGYAVRSADQGPRHVVVTAILGMPQNILGLVTSG